MSRHLLFSISLLSVPLFGAPAQPQLVAGYDFVCLLGQTAGHSEVRCWDPVGRALPTIPLHDPSALASTAHEVCAIDGGQAKCWEYRRGERAPEHDYHGPFFGN